MERSVKLMEKISSINSQALQFEQKPFSNQILSPKNIEILGVSILCLTDSGNDQTQSEKFHSCLIVIKRPLPKR